MPVSFQIEEVICLVGIYDVNHVWTLSFGLEFSFEPVGYLHGSSYRQYKISFLEGSVFDQSGQRAQLIWLGTALCFASPLVVVHLGLPVVVALTQQSDVYRTLLAWLRREMEFALQEATSLQTRIPRRWVLIGQVP